MDESDIARFLHSPFKQLDNALDDLILLTALCGIRLFAALSILPATSEQFIGGLVRAGFTTTLALYVAFGMPEAHLQAFTAFDWIGLIVKEALIGAAIGFAASTVFWTASCVGALFDMQSGYNSVELANPMSGQSSTPISNMLLSLTVSVFYLLGGLLVFLGAIFESYKIWPLMAPLPSLAGTAEVFVVQQVDSLMTAVVKFAAPVLLILVLIDLGFGLMTRTAGRIEPASLSQPIKGAVTVLLLALLVGLFLAQVRQFLLPSDLLQRLQGLVS